MTVSDTQTQTIPEVLDEVGDDPGLAAQALAAELEQGEAARSTLVTKLRQIIAAPESETRFAFVDGGSEALRVPSGKTVTKVTDRTTGTVVDPEAYSHTDDGMVKAAGGTWARGTARWSLDFEG